MTSGLLPGVSSSVLQSAGNQAMLKSVSRADAGEWKGLKSAKFTTSKRHLPPAEAADNKPHPLFSMGAKRHFTAQRSDEFNWKPSVK